MTHEGNNAFFRLIGIERIQLFGHQGNILICILQQGHTKLQGHICQIVIVEITISIVGEVLDVVDHTGVLLTRDHLQRLNHDLVILHTFGSKGIEPERRCVVETRICVLTGSCTGA